MCQIVKNSPNIDKKYAMKLSNIIYKMHRKYHIPSRIFTAILRQESGYSLRARGKQCILFEGNKVCGPSDFGISQIHINNVIKLRLDFDKLTNDLEYSVEAGAKILAGFMKRYEARDNNWWVRYNCGTRSSTKRDTCQIYKKLVERYL